MHVLVTGSLGYVAPSVIHSLRKSFPDAVLTGVDTGWFIGSLTDGGRPPESHLDSQRFVDVRDMTAADLAGVTHVVHLAALSNDPLGDTWAEVTEAINLRASLRLLDLSQQAGVKGFVFASSASVYGAGSATPRTEASEVNPLTAYARSKIDFERQAAERLSGEMVLTCLRFSTACGWSPRTRLDLVLNDFVATALSTGRIEVLSDGTPWRPLVHVDDMGRAIAWALSDDRRQQPEKALTVQVGRDDWNFQVGQLASLVAEVLGGIEVSINEQAPPDARSYRLDFTRWREIAPRHQPVTDITKAIQQLADNLRHLDLTDFRQGKLMRLNVVRDLVDQGALTGDLAWAVA